MISKSSTSRIKEPSRYAQEEALARARSLLSAVEYERLLRELERPLRPAIRANPLKMRSPAEAVSAWSQEYAWDVESVPYCDTGWWVRGRETELSLGKTPQHRMGMYYIQDAASMLPVELFDFSSLKSPLVLDMAASPGGKTTHLASRTLDHGLVIANDSSAARITALRLVLDTWGAANAAVTRFPGEKFGDWYPGMFDVVLLDAPCSMENLRSTETHPMRPISERERGSLAKRQLRLLESAFKAVKLGGQVVYATCTLAPEEDEAVLDALLKPYPDSISIEDVRRHLPVPAPGITSNGEVEYHPMVRRALRLYPHMCGTSGFFSALIRKTSVIDLETEPPPQRSLGRVGFAPLTRHDAKELKVMLLDRYGFELETLLQEQGLSLWRRNKSIYAFPEAYLDRFAGLPCQSLGLEIGEWTPPVFIPTHAWVTRFYGKFVHGSCTIADEWISVWMRGENVPFQGCRASNGSIVIVVDGRGEPLGRAKVFSQRLKNMLPRRVVLG